MRSVPFALPDISEAEIEAVVEVLRSGWLTTGPRVTAFEKAFADYLGVRHAVAVNSCTAALHLALDAINLRPGDEVIVPTYTFTASAEVVRYSGARPVLVDVRRDTLTIHPERARQAVTARTRAIVGVDIAGQACDWKDLRAIACDRNLVLVDDAAHALPSFLDDRPVGTWADLTAFSFYATKTLTTGEGGMLVTDNDERADRARIMALHGIKRDAWKRYSGEGTWNYDVVAPGFKYNMTDIAAALGLVQLERLEEMHARRLEVADAYSRAFSAMDALEVPSVERDRVSSWHLYLLRLNLDRLRCSRERFVEELSARGIGVSVHFIPLHLHSYYRDTYGYTPTAFPVAYAEYQRVVSLPIYSRMDQKAVARVIEAVAEVATAYAA